MKRDLSFKICGTREFFVPFRENQWYRNYRLNSAAGCIRCVTFLSWLTITKKLEPKNRMWFRFVASFINGWEGLMTKFVMKIYMKHGKFVKICTWNGTMTSQLLPSRLGKLILILFNNANSNDYHRRFVMKVELDGHWDVKAEQNLTLTLTKPLNSNVNSLIWVSIFVVSWLTWIFWAENRWKLVLTFKHIFKGCSLI